MTITIVTTRLKGAKPVEYWYSEPAPQAAFRSGVRVFAALAVVGVLLAMGTPALSSAESPWSFGSRLRLETCYDETVLPRSGPDRDAASAFCTMLGLGLQMRYRRTADRVDLRYDGRLRQYEEIEERDSMMHRVTGRWIRSLDSGLTLRLDERVTYREDTGGENDESITRPATYLGTATAFGITGRIAKRWQPSLRLATETRSYADTSIDNWYTLTPSAEIAYIQNRDCRWTLKHEFSYLSVEKEDRERTHRVLAGYVCTLPYKLRFDVRAGILAWGDRTTTDPAGSVSVSRRWSKASLSLRWRRTASVSSGSGRVVRRDYLLVQPTYRLTPKTRALGRVSMVIQESLDDDRTDTTTWRSGLVLRRDLLKRVTADLAYTYVDQTVRGRSGRALSGNIVSVGMTASF